METPTKAIKAVAVKTGNTPADMIRMAVAGGADLEKLKGLLELQKEWEANEAKKAYHKAMTAFKAEPIRIEKKKAVSFGQGKTAYKHATLAQVTEAISAGLSRHGLSAAWKTDVNGSIKVTCIITHELGHSESTALSAQSDKSGSKNDIQAIGSTVTYLERYTLLALTGLATFDMDDDGQAAVTAFISEAELHQLRDHLASENLDEAKTCDYLKVESLEKLPKPELARALRLKKAVKK